MKKIYITLMLIVLIHVISFAQPGSFDLSFNSTGKVMPNFSGYNDMANTTEIQSDGKILVGGRRHDGSNNDFALIRLNSDGSIDNTFDTDGIVITSIGVSSDEIYDISIQADGKILAVGYTENLSGKDIALARYNTDGTLDNTFDGDGIVTTAIGTNYDVGFSMLLQPDGKIIVGGIAGNGTYDFGLVRYNTNGSLDNTFDFDGKVSFGIGTRNDYIQKILLQPDNKIVAAGYMFNGRDHDIAVARFNNDGSIDSSFDTDGKIVTPIGADHDYCVSAVLQSDGKIIVVGNTQNSVAQKFGLVRYNTNGSLDNTFDGDGILTSSISSQSDFATSIKIQADGKLVVAGYTYFNGDFAMARYNSDGTFDNTFDYDGVMNIDFGSGGDGINDLAIQSDGKYVVCGYYNDSINQQRFAIARLNDVCGIVNNSVTQTGFTLTASLTGAKYQWINCSTNLPLIGDTLPSLVVTSNGNYAVIIDQNGCIDTSSCFLISNVGITNDAVENQLSLYPNPTESWLEVISTSTIESYDIYDINGAIVLHNTIQEKVANIDVSILNNGIYFIKITNNENTINIKKFIKNGVN